MTPPADFIITNARIFTSDPDQPEAEALAVSADRIIYVGTQAGAQKWRTDQTRMIDGQGHTLTPGFIDSHFHLLWGSIWLSGVLKGDFGDSIKFHRPASDMIAERIPNTLVLVGLSFLITLLIAIPVGTLSACKPYSFFDHVITTLTFIGQSLPVYWLGLGLRNQNAFSFSLAKPRSTRRKPNLQG